MGLMNIGRSEGAQVIQLFGRGVRLKGRGVSLKRSSGDPLAPSHLHLLETLNIFAIRADYLHCFKDSLWLEGVELTGNGTSVTAVQASPHQQSVAPQARPERRAHRQHRSGCAQGCIMPLAPDPSVRVHIDLSPALHVIRLTATETGVRRSTISATLNLSLVQHSAERECRQQSLSFQDETAMMLID